MKVTKRVNLKGSHHKEKKDIVTIMGRDVKQTYQGDHFSVYLNSRSLCTSPETNMLYDNYTSITINKNTKIITTRTYVFNQPNK